MPSLLSIAMICWLLCEAFIFRRDAAPTAGSDVDRGSRALIVIAIAGSIFAAIACARAVPSAAMPWSRATATPVGASLIFAGLALRIWAVKTLGRFFRTKVTMLADHALVRHGPYAIIRHPAYAGALLSCLGLGLALSNWLALAVMAIGPGMAFARRIAVEEAALDTVLGADWRAYRQRSWAVLPPLW